MRVFTVLFSIILVLIIFSGCNDEILNEHAALNTKIAEIKCAKEFECCKTSMKPKHYETIEECIRYNQFISAESVDYLEFSNYTWNEENAKKCLEYWNSFSLYSYSCEDDVNIAEAAISEETKTEINELKSSCDNLLKGAAGLGVKCYPDISHGAGCAEGLICNEMTYECEKIPGINESCIEIDECYTELEKQIYCDKKYYVDDEGNKVITEAVCKYAPVLGEDCSSFKKCDSYLEDVFCEMIYKKDSDGNYEYDDKTGEKMIVSAKCKKLPAKGENCELSGRCEKEDEGKIYCAREKDEDGNSEYFCREYQKVNMPCGEDGECAKDLICKYGEDEEGDSSEICIAKLREGIKCSDTNECEDDLFCKYDENQENSTCAKKLPAHSDCTDSDQCISGQCSPDYDGNYYCSGSTLTDQICVQFDYGDNYSY